MQPVNKPIPQVNYTMIRNLSDTEPWRSLAAHNTPGPLPSDVPVFLAQGSADTNHPARSDSRLHATPLHAHIRVNMLALPESFIASRLRKLRARPLAG